VPGEGGDGGGERAAAHGVNSAEEVSDVILAHADRDGWVGAAMLAEVAMGDPPGPTGSPYAARRHFARRLSAHSGVRKRAIRKRGYPPLSTFTL
jgi:hypothetical protein